MLDSSFFGRRQKDLTANGLKCCLFLLLRINLVAKIFAEIQICTINKPCGSCHTYLSARLDCHREVVMGKYDILLTTLLLQNYWRTPSCLCPLEIMGDLSSCHRVTLCLNIEESNISQVLEEKN